MRFTTYTMQAANACRCAPSIPLAAAHGAHLCTCCCSLLLLCSRQLLLMQQRLLPLDGFCLHKRGLRQQRGWVGGLLNQALRRWRMPAWHVLACLAAAPRTRQPLITIGKQKQKNRSTSMCWLAMCTAANISTQRRPRSASRRSSRSTASRLLPSASCTRQICSQLHTRRSAGIKGC